MLKLISLWKDHFGNLGKLQKFLAKAIAGTFGLKVVNALLLYTNSLLLARVLGTSGFGAYSYASAWVYLLLIPAVLGLEGLVLREISVYNTKSEWHLSKGLLKWSRKVVFWNSILVSALAIAGFWLFLGKTNINLVWVMSIAFLAVPAEAIARLRQPTMHAIGKIVIGQLPDTLIRPLLLCLFLLISIFFLDTELGAQEAVALKVVAAIVACIVGEFLLSRHLSPKIKKVRPSYQSKLWMKSALPMLFIGSMYIVNNLTDTIMLGSLDSTEAVGLYTVANRGAGLITFILIAFDTSIAPTFASLHTQGERGRLQEIVTKSCQANFAIALIMATILIIFGKSLLLLFGSEFVAGHSALTILSLGQLVNAFTGSVALLLIMTGFDKYTAIGVSVSAVINIILNSILIPLYSVEGAAIATAISMVCWNIILVYFAYQKLKINSTAIGFPKADQA